MLRFKIIFARFRVDCTISGSKQKFVLTSAFFALFRAPGAQSFLTALQLFSKGSVRSSFSLICRFCRFLRRLLQRAEFEVLQNKFKTSWPGLLQ